MSNIPIEEEIPQFVQEKDRYIEIYKITNTETGKIYIGQAVSHMLNHGKYRRYGSKKRLDSHFSEAMKNNKDKECRYLNNSIRKYGISKFIVELIDTCPMDKGDETEAKYITECNSVFPFGYNLKIGGTVFKHCEESRRILSESYYKSLDKTDKTDTLKEDIKFKSQEQLKLERFDDTDLPEDIDNYDKFIRIAKLTGVKKLVMLKIGEIEISFGSKKLTTDELRNNCIDFIKKLKKYKEEHKNSAKLLDVPETPNSNDNFAENNEHIASKDEYIKSIEIYKQHLKQKKAKKQFNFICRVCNIQKIKEDFRGKQHICRPCERLENQNRFEASKEKYRELSKLNREKHKDKINAKRREQRRLVKLANETKINANNT
jgi:hypothetical protein